LRYSRATEGKFLLTEDTLFAPDHLNAAGAPEVRRLIEMLNRDAQVAQYLKGQPFDLNEVRTLGERIASVREPQTARVVAPTTGAPELRLDNGATLKLAEFVAATSRGGPVPVEWATALGNKTTAIDLRGVSDRQVEILLKSLHDAGKKIPGATLIYQVSDEPLGDRLQESLKRQRVEVLNEPVALRSVGERGRRLAEWLEERTVGSAGQRVRLVLDEFDAGAESMKNLLDRIAKEPRGQIDYVIGECNRRDLPKYRAFAREAMRRGARSVSFSTMAIDGAATALQIAHWEAHPQLGELPYEGMQRCAAAAQELLKRAIARPDFEANPEEVLDEVFEEYSLDVSTLFKTPDGKVSRKLIDDAIKRLAEQASSWVGTTFEMDAPRTDATVALRHAPRRPLAA
jgi:hypothetical protein